MFYVPKREMLQRNKSLAGKLKTCTYKQIKKTPLRAHNLFCFNFSPGSKHHPKDHFSQMMLPLTLKGITINIGEEDQRKCFNKILLYLILQLQRSDLLGEVPNVVI